MYFVNHSFQIIQQMFVQFAWTIQKPRGKRVYLAQNEQLVPLSLWILKATKSFTLNFKSNKEFIKSAQCKCLKWYCNSCRQKNKFNIKVHVRYCHFASTICLSSLWTFYIYLFAKMTGLFWTKIWCSLTYSSFEWYICGWLYVVQIKVINLSALWWQEWGVLLMTLVTDRLIFV
jgi:hypothetical protein